MQGITWKARKKIAAKKSFGKNKSTYFSSKLLPGSFSSCRLSSGLLGTSHGGKSSLKRKKDNRDDLLQKEMDKILICRTETQTLRKQDYKKP